MDKKGHKNIIGDIIPSEVAHVMVIIYYGQPIGSDTHDMCERVIKENPDYFPWETKYATIPKEVHEKYHNLLYHKTKKEPFVSDGNGLMAYIKQQEPVEIKPITVESFKNFMKWMEDDYKKGANRKKEIKSIWKQVYGEYGLEFRESLYDKNGIY